MLLTLDRILGLLIFLPVPLVLALFLAVPFGAPASLAAGIVIMLTHRLYARPWALARAGTRCLWCGAPAGDGPTIEIEEPPGRTEWRCCGASHEGRLRGFLGFAERHRALLLAGILGGLAAFLVVAVLAALHFAGPVVHADAAAGFRIVIALSVLPLGFLGPRSRGARRDVPRAPFPVHIQALIGSAGVMWLFRLVGLWWLGAGVAHFVTR